jgi:hypothetical protein
LTLGKIESHFLVTAVMKQVVAKKKSLHELAKTDSTRDNNNFAAN